jgi:hypothetical protein
MYWDVVEVRPVAPRTLMVRFADGLNGTIHISRAFCTGVFEVLLEDLQHSPKLTRLLLIFLSQRAEPTEPIPH